MFSSVSRSRRVIAIANNTPSGSAIRSNDSANVRATGSCLSRVRSTVSQHITLVAAEMAIPNAIHFAASTLPIHAPMPASTTTVAIVSPGQTSHVGRTSRLSKCPLLSRVACRIFDRPYSAIYFRTRVITSRCQNPSGNPTPNPTRVQTGLVPKLRSAHTPNLSLIHI